MERERQQAALHHQATDWQARRRLAQQKYLKKHPDQAVLNTHRRRAKQRQAEGEISKADLAWLKERHKRCPGCRRKFGKALKATVDHVIALVNGGSNSRKNLQLLCRSCNAQKNRLDNAEFMRRKGHLL